MPELPDIPAQDFLLGLASAGVLLWAALYVARSRALDSWWDMSRDGDRPRAGDLELYTPVERPSSHLTFLASLFAHLTLIALIPWLEALFPGDLPFNFRQYDMVIVQFKMREAPLRLPAEFQSKPRREVAENRLVDPLDAVPSEVDDPGRGDRREAPESEEESGGEGEAEQPLQRLEIVVPERPKPRPTALVEVAERPEMAIPLPSPALGLSGAAWSFRTPDIDDIPKPGLPALAELGVTRPELAVAPGAGATLPDSITRARGLRPALSDLMPVNGLGELGEEGYGALLAPPDDGGALSMLADALRGGPLGGLLEGAGGDGGGEGSGAGEGAGVSGAGGEGLGKGWDGRGPVPRKLHGIIMISNETTTIPEAEDLLTGNPVYTVYVQVPGFAKKWVLQVCVPGPGAGNVIRDGGVLRVLPRKSLDPPYALTKLPVDLSFDVADPRQIPPRLVIFARVDKEGELRDLRVVTGVDPSTDDRVLARLQEWDFHPAYRDGAPVAVEAVFGIPLR